MLFLYRFFLEWSIYTPFWNLNFHIQYVMKMKLGLVKAHDKRRWQIMSSHRVMWLMGNVRTRNHFETNSRDEVDKVINHLNLQRNSTWLIFNFIPCDWFVAASIWTMPKKVEFYRIENVRQYYRKFLLTWQFWMVYTNGI